MRYSKKELLEYIDDASYETFIKLIGIAGIICMVLISWISFFSFVGAFIHLNFRLGILSLFIFWLSIVIWRGSGKLYEKLKISQEE